MTYQSKASDGSKGPRLEAETLKVTKGGKPPGCSTEKWEECHREHCKAEYCRLAEGRKQRLSLLTPSRTARLRRLMLARSQSNRMRSAGGKTADPLLLASQRCKLKTSIKGFLRNRQTLFQSSCKTALENYLIVSYKM